MADTEYAISVVNIMKVRSGYALSSQRKLLADKTKTTLRVIRAEYLIIIPFCLDLATKIFTRRPLKAFACEPPLSCIRDLVG